ncbi:MAG: hypothetical protein JNM67_08770 [Bacteroidetes bacterium]|nr:hypothetical protein [Bacteroidota bacterium]
MLLRFLFKILVIYAIWQLIKMIISVKKTQQNFHEKMEEMNRDMHNKHASQGKRKDDGDGEYIDYEEVK